MSYENIKRYGANRNAVTTSPNVKAAPSFAVARRSLYDILSQYCFGKIVELVEMPATETRLSFFHGKILVVNNSYFQQQQGTSRNAAAAAEYLFFDKAGRQKSMISIGPAKLIDTVHALGHKNAVPQLGEILIGLKVENTNEKRLKLQPFIFRSWSMNGKIILDLFRMVQYGTKMSDLEIRPLFRQTAGAVAQKIKEASGESLPFEQKVSMLKCVRAIDDIYIVAKMILWGNVRLLTVLHSLQSDSCLIQMATEAEIGAASDLKISATALEFVHGISQKLNDDKIMIHFTECFSTFSAVKLKEEQDHQDQAPRAPWKPYDLYPAPAQTQTDQTPALAQTDQTPPPWKPFDVKEEKQHKQEQGAMSPIYNPSSPMYGESNSPMYVSATKDTITSSESKASTLSQPQPPAPEQPDDMEDEHSPLSSPPSSPSQSGDQSPIEPPPTQGPKRKSRWADASVSQMLEKYV
jgi:hypothetical protein